MLVKNTSVMLMDFFNTLRLSSTYCRYCSLIPAFQACPNLGYLLKRPVSTYFDIELKQGLLVEFLGRHTFCR